MAAALARSALDWGALLMVTPAWHYIGKVASTAQLPLITGYLVGGILCGPYGINLLHEEALGSFRVAEYACLSIIATAAGCEMNLQELKRTLKQVATLTLSIASASWVMTYIAVILIAHEFPFMQPHIGDARLLVPVASLAATISMARSPASAIAILNEVSGKGPYCSLVMSVVIAKDLITFVAFAINLELVGMVFTEGGHPTIMLFVRPLSSLLISGAIGFVGNAVLTIFLRAKMPGHTKPTIKWFKSAVVVMVACAVFSGAELLGGDGLLVCVVMGLLVVNKRTEAVTRELHEAMDGCLDRVMRATQVLFFGLAGANLRLSQVLGGASVALVLYIVRLAAIVVGSYVGSLAGGVAPEVRRRVWAGMITQAGIALGLSRTIAARFPDWGLDFSSFVAGAILLNLLTGPPLFKMAVRRMGEARADGRGRAKEKDLTSVMVSDTTEGARLRVDLQRTVSGGADAV